MGTAHDERGVADLEPDGGHHLLAALRDPRNVYTDVAAADNVADEGEPDDEKPRVEGVLAPESLGEARLMTIFRMMVPA